MKAKRSLLVLAAGCCAIAFAWQQTAQKYVLLDDKKGGFKVYDVESALTSFEPDGDVAFEATGRPVRGYSKEQGLVFSANRVEGTAARTGAGSFRIKTGSLVGNALFDVTSTSSGGATSIKSHLESQSVSLNEVGDESRVVFSVPFLFSNHVVSETVDRLLELRAPSGVFTLPLLDQTSGSNNPFKSADVKGPLAIKVDSKQKVSSGVNRQVVTLNADRMTYDGTTRILRLDGNVVGDVETTPATGNPYALMMNASWVTIEMNEDSTIKKVLSGIGSVKAKGGGE